MSDTIRELADMFAGLAREFTHVPQAAHAATCTEDTSSATATPGPDASAQMSQMVDLLLSIEDGEVRKQVSETLTRWRAASTPAQDIPWFCRV